ncbi:hypothetical protein EH223_01965 [candidate division KSB1 bacterium]|nr:S46 family peptidase [candidate division KSB1 bacterium]RQW06695.1 MAG: hypothetical protein EH223_01965 [candidate division KSB1 bacterium]
MIGPAFDGNYKSLTSDWQYDYDVQRYISVDIRYVLFFTEKHACAGCLLQEMGVNLQADQEVIIKKYLLLFLLSFLFFRHARPIPDQKISWHFPQSQMLLL